MPRRRATLLLALFIAPAVLMAQEGRHDDESSLDRAARRYRITVYQLYRSDRDEFNHRLATATKLLNDWDDSQRDRLFAQDLERWFENATTNMRHSQDHALPPLPLVPERIATSAPPPESTDASAMPPGPDSNDTTANQRLPSNSIKNKRPLVPHATQQPNGTLSDSTETAHPSANSTSRSAPARSEEFGPYEAPGIPPTRPSYPRDPRVLHESLPEIHFHRDVAQSEHDVDVSILRNPTNVASILPTRLESDRDGSEGQASIEQQVDVDVLNAKILHFNLQLSDVESDLRNRAAWTLDSLATIAERIDLLINEHGHITLFLDLLTPERRLPVVKIASPNATRALFAQRMFELRIERANQAAEFDTLEHAQWLEKMEELATRLDSWNRDE